jgi:pimeloyl-ACP methyl ester carboxylesterase
VKSLDVEIQRKSSRRRDDPEMEVRYLAAMAEFVLVPGAWLGAWAWNAVVPELRSAGHGAYPLTLSGVADRQGVPAGQQTHVQDIVDEIESHDLRDVVLVGHSYSGIPVGQAGERIGDRLTRVVFVDSNVPIDGESFASGWYEGAAALEASIAENGGFWQPLNAADYDGQGLTDDQIAQIVDGSTPHPGDTLTEPAVLERSIGELPVTYIKCLLDSPEPSATVAELLGSSERWRLVTMDTGHWPMFSQPRELAAILLDTVHP